MPKPLKKAARNLKTPAKPKRPSDPNRAAHAMLAEHMARVQVEAPLDFEAQYRAHMARLGKKGGKKSGRTRKEWLSPERRSEIASTAAKAMWEKRRKKEGGG